jgi:putative acetyltransferase
VSADIKQTMPRGRIGRVIIRRENQSDRAAVDAVTSEAFQDPGGDREAIETKLLRELRLDVGWLPPFSMVAVDEDQILGHVVCTRGWIGDIGALGLGPISVLPRYQRQAIGQALMHSIIGAADAAGEPLIALLGDRDFYRRFGFVPAEQLGIAAPDPSWGQHFMVRTLTDCPPSITGTFRYAAPFAAL